MTAERTPSPSGSAGPLRAVPQLVFEIKRTVGTLSTAGFGPGYGANQEVALLSSAALDLQRALGMEQFSILLTLAMAAQVEPGGLAVDGATKLLVEQTGWSRQKTSRLLTSLEEAGFIHREQDRKVLAGGKTGFSAMRTWLAPELYQTVERRLTVASAPPISGVTLSGVTRSNTREEAPGVSIPVSTPSVVTERDTTAVSAGRSADAVRDTSETRQHHEDEDDYELHSSRVDDDEQPASPTVDRDLAGLRVVVPASLRPPGSRSRREPTPVVTAVEVRQYSPGQTLELLRSWRVMRPDQLIESTPSNVMDQAIATVLSRLEDIDTPGAYLRKLLRDAAVGAVPAPRAAARTKAVVSEPSAVDGVPPRVHAGPSSAEPAAVDVVGLIAAAMDSLPSPVREELERKADAAADSAEWLRGRRGPLRDGYRRSRLIELLQGIGALPAEVAASTG